MQQKGLPTPSLWTFRWLSRPKPTSGALFFHQIKQANESDPVRSNLRPSKEHKDRKIVEALPGAAHGRLLQNLLPLLDVVSKWEKGAKAPSFLMCNLAANIQLN